MIMKICDMYQISTTKIMQSFYNGDKICENSELNKRNKMTIQVLTKKKLLTRLNMKTSNCSVSLQMRTNFSFSSGETLTLNCDAAFFFFPNSDPKYLGR